VRRHLNILLSAAVLARLLLQVLAMPPYAGLDEAYHVARVAFVAREGREPGAGEPSIPRYLARSMGGAVGAPPAFGVIAARWPEAVAALPEGFADVPLSRGDTGDYLSANYEAQQPSLYYELAALLDRAAGSTQLRELLGLRLLAALLGVLTALATGLLAARLAGPAGFLAGLLLASTPTWIALVARAGNDALACAALALALLLSTRSRETWSSRLAEAACWAAATASKLTTWPAALLLPLLWPEGATRKRRWLVAVSILAAAVLTVLDLSERTSTPVGQQGLAEQLRLGGDGWLGRLAAMPWGSFLKLWAAQALWTSGQHGNFVRPLGLAILLAPWLLLATAAVDAPAPSRRSLRVLIAAAVLFALSQAAHAYGFLREAAALGLPQPRAGFEGWYVHTFDPLWFGLGLGALLAAPARRGRLLLALGTLGVLAADVFLHEGALFRDYAGLSSPQTPDLFFRWGGGGVWAALERLRLYGLGLPSAWLAVGLRLTHLAAALLIVRCLWHRGDRLRQVSGDPVCWPSR